MTSLVWSGLGLSIFVLVMVGNNCSFDKKEREMVVRNN